MPELSAVIVAPAAPPSVTVAPLPLVAGLIVPDTLKVRVVAAKFKPVLILPPLTVTLRLLGLKVQPAWLGVTEYVPLAKPVKVKFPELLAVVVTFAAPLSVIVAPPPPAAGLIVPEIL